MLRAMSAPHREYTVGPAYRPDGSGPITVTVCDGRIARVDTATGDVDRRRILAPGLIDIQVNGYGGIDLTRAELTPAELRRMVDLLAAEGVTRLVPTIVTSSHETYIGALRAMAAACEQNQRVRDAVVCLHVEGPWISPDDGPRGAHPLEHVRPPNRDEFQAWQDAAGGRIGYVTLAPEVDGALDMIRRLADAGIVVAIGHTAADADQIRAAADAGAKLSTHLGNGSHAVLDRHNNYIWQQAAEDRLWASFIADGHHLPAAALQCLIRAKTPARSIITSDAAPIAGLPPGRYHALGADVEIRPDGRLCLTGTPYLAGSAQGLFYGITTAVRIAKISFTQAMAMATAHPAKLFAIDHESGTIAAGLRADLIELDWPQPPDGTPTLQRTIAAGVTTYERT